MNGVLRILDANLNRAREALRVVEDYARFVLNDDALCGELKQLRHDLVAATRSCRNPFSEPHNASSFSTNRA